jgi:hypothetical protein
MAENFARHGDHRGRLLAPLPPGRQRLPARLRHRRALLLPPSAAPPRGEAAGS